MLFSCSGSSLKSSLPSGPTPSSGFPGGPSSSVTLTPSCGIRSSAVFSSGRPVASWYSRHPKANQSADGRTWRLAQPSPVTLPLQLYSTDSDLSLL